MNRVLIVAMSRDHIIGTETGLPWHLPADLKRFRRLTLGKPVILGRKTLEAIGRPLPQRSNIVLTRQTDWTSPGVLVSHSVPDALDLAQVEANRLGVDDCFVIGGAEIYRVFLPLIDRLELTVVQGPIVGTVRFPVSELLTLPLSLIHCEEQPADERNPHAMTFLRFDRDSSRTHPLTLKELGLAEPVLDCKTGRTVPIGQSGESR